MSTMYKNSSGNQQISDREREAFKNALPFYYSGKGKIIDAFAEVEPGLIDRYHRRKKREDRPPLPGLLGVRTDFRRMSAVTPDGRRITVALDQDGEIIESEDE